MIKREFKINFKSFIIWLFILMGIFLITFLVYPSLMTNDQKELINEALKSFPPEIIKAFNMDLTGVDSAYGWFKTEGIIFVILLSGVFSANLGSSILLKEENDKVIEYLNQLPISRNKIIINKLIVSFTYITLFLFILFLFNFIGLNFVDEINIKEFMLLSFSPLLSSYVIFSLCIFISTFYNKTRKTFGIGLGIVFISYFFNIISGLNEKVENFKFFSIFTLVDVRNIIINQKLNIFMPLICLILVLLFLSLTFINYNKKEFI